MRQGNWACSHRKPKLKCKLEALKEGSILSQRLQESPKRTTEALGLRASKQRGCTKHGLSVCGCTCHIQCAGSVWTLLLHSACAVCVDMPSRSSGGSLSSQDGQPALPSPTCAPTETPPRPPFLTHVSLTGCYAGLPITSSGLRASLQGTLPLLLLHGPQQPALAPNPQGLCSPVTQHRPLSLVPREPHPLASTPPTWLPRPGVRPLLQEAFPGSLILRAHSLWDCHTELPLRCHRGFALVSSLSPAR